MKRAVTALVVATLALAGTPVRAENPVEPGAPGSDKTTGVTPNDAKASPPKETPKETGATNPDTPDPTKTLREQRPRTDAGEASVSGRAAHGWGFFFLEHPERQIVFAASQ